MTCDTVVCYWQGLSDIAWEHRDRYLATASDDTTLRLWEAATGECLRTLEGHTHYVFCCAFNPVKPILVMTLSAMYPLVDFVYHYEVEELVEL